MTIIQVVKEKWNPHYGCIHLCEISRSPDEMATIYGIEFEDYIEDGLGKACTAVVDIDESLYILQGFREPSAPIKGVVVQMQGNNPGVSNSIDSILKAFGLQKSDLSWVQDYYDFPCWSLVRQGDDGNEVEVTRFYRKQLAEHIMDVYTKRGHKQCYTIKNITSQDRDCT